MAIDSGKQAFLNEKFPLRLDFYDSYHNPVWNESDEGRLLYNHLISDLRADACEIRANMDADERAKGSYTLIISALKKIKILIPQGYLSKDIVRKAHRNGVGLDGLMANSLEPSDFTVQTYDYIKYFFNLYITTQQMEKYYYNPLDGYMNDALNQFKIYLPLEDKVKSTTTVTGADMPILSSEVW